MHHQKGMTFIGMLLTAVLVICAALLLVTSIPVYLANYSIVQAVKSMNSIPANAMTGDIVTDIHYLKNNLGKRLDTNGIYDFKQDQADISLVEANKFIVKVKYEVKKHLAYNVSLLFEFDDSIEVVPGSES